MRHQLYKYFAVFLAIAVLFCGGIVTHAETAHTLRVKFITESGPVTNSTLKLYPALTSDGELMGDFAELPVEVGDLSDSGNLKRLAYTLASYAASGTGEVRASDVTNGLGYVDFTGLPVGIYLVTGSSGTIGDLMYTPKPILITITDTVEEPLEANLKYSVTASSIVNAYTVKKVWADTDGTAHPQSVTVDLFRNGALYDEVTLSSDNDWTHRWESLSSNYDWNVVEKNFPANYTVSITLEARTFTIENTAVPTEPTEPATPVTSETEPVGTDTSEPAGTDSSEPVDADPSEPTEASEPDDTDTSEPTEPTPEVSESGTVPGTPSGTPNSTNATNSTDPTTQNPPAPPSGGTNPPQLPQTGQLWFPVPILFILGAMLFFVGFIADRLSEDDEKE